MCGVVPTYGENLKRVRDGRAQTALAKAHGYAGQGNLHSYERNTRLPTPELVRTHAKMTGCATWELMLGAVMGFDAVRFPDLSEAQLEGLLAGIALMKKGERVALAVQGAKALAQFLAEEESKRALRAKAESQEKASRKHRVKTAV